jgi:hypothetical protein
VTWLLVTWPENRCSIPNRGEDFLFDAVSGTAPRPRQTCIQWTPEVIPAAVGLKRPEHETDNSRPSIKNMLNYTLIPTHVFMAWCLIKHRNTKFTHFYILSDYGECRLCQSIALLISPLRSDLSRWVIPLIFVIYMSFTNTDICDRDWATLYWLKWSGKASFNYWTDRWRGQQKIIGTSIYWKAVVKIKVSGEGGKEIGVLKANTERKKAPFYYRTMKLSNVTVTSSNQNSLLYYRYAQIWSRTVFFCNMQKLAGSVWCYISIILTFRGFGSRWGHWIFQVT